MIRFQPDTIGQALMRFFDMAAPDANVYVEIPAPDIRLAAIVLLTVTAVLTWRRLGPGRQAVFAMVGVMLLSTVAWLASTGNGRYFLPLLVAAGPIAIGLVCALPSTRPFKAALAMLLLAGQGFMLQQQSPWNTWTVLNWKDRSYFDVRLPVGKDAGPTTYASVSLLTYSLIAPQFPPQSRWINLYTTPATPLDEGRTDAFIRRALAEGPVKLVAPSLAWASTPEGTPNPEMVQALDKLLIVRNLRVSGRCDYLDAPGMLSMAELERGAQEGTPPKLGFWTCPLAYVAAVPPALANQGAPAKVQLVFSKLGEICPRFFPPGENQLRRLPDGWLRSYSSQTRVYVLDNGQVWYHFWRSLNPVLLGQSSDLLAGEVQFDCLGVRNDGAWKTGAR